MAQSWGKAGGGGRGGGGVVGGKGHGVRVQLGVMEWLGQGFGSDAGGGLCHRLLLAAPHAAGLLFVAQTHLLRDVHQSTAHRKT